MKSFLFVALACINCLGFKAQNSFSVCFGSSLTLVASNSQNWSTPSYTLLPDQITSSTGSFNVFVYSSFTYTIILSGKDASQQTQTMSTTYTVTVKQLPGFTQSPNLNSIYLTCYQPSLTVSNSPSSLSYSWTNFTISKTGASVTFTNGMSGSWMITATDNTTGCSSISYLTVNENFNTYTASISPLFQIITCTANTVSQVTISAQSGIQTITSPQKGVFNINSNYGTFLPGAPGVYTCCTTDPLSGCQSCKSFTVNANGNFPTFNLTSPTNFNIGCSTKSIVTVTYSNPQSTPPGQNPLSYTMLAAGSPTTLPSTLGNVTTYSINLPGTYTAIVKDNSNSCISRVPFSITQNTTVAPAMILGPTVLSCSLSTTILQAISTNTSVIYTWSVTGSGPVVNGATVTANSMTASPTSSIGATFFLELKDTSTYCASIQTVIVYQNLFPPSAMYSPFTNLTLTCLTPSLVMTNQSKSNIPKNSIFPTSLPAVGYLWEGPPPSLPTLFSTQYVVTVPGVHTLTTMDLNNGCTSATTFTVGDNMIYPLVNNPNSPGPANLCVHPTATLAPIITSALAGLTYTWSAPNNATTSGTYSQNLVTNTPGVYTLSVKSPSGCVAQVTMEVIYCVGITYNSLFSSVHFFPNPATDQLTVSGLPTDNYTWFISDLSGKIVNSGRLKHGEVEINTKQLNSGLYLLTLKNSTGLSESRKILKE